MQYEVAIIDIIEKLDELQQLSLLGENFYERPAISC